MTVGLKIYFLMVLIHDKQCRILPMTKGRFERGEAEITKGQETWIDIDECTVIITVTFTKAPSNAHALTAPNPNSKNHANATHNCIHYSQFPTQKQIYLLVNLPFFPFPFFCSFLRFSRPLTRLAFNFFCCVHSLACLFILQLASTIVATTFSFGVFLGCGSRFGATPILVRSSRSTLLLFVR